MTLARYFSFLLIGMFTSMVILSMAFQLDFRMFVSDMFAQLTQGDSYSTASFTAPSEDEELVVVPEEVEGITVGSQISILRNLTNLVQITGIVPDWQVYEQLELQCASIFPSSKIENDVQVFEDADKPNWLRHLEELAVTAALDKVKNANIAIDNELIEMTGTVSTGEIRDAVLADLNSLAKEGHGVTVSARLSVEAIAPEFDLWMATSDTLLLQGALGSNAKAGLIRFINEHLSDNRRLVESMEINDDIPDPEWLPTVHQMIPDLLVNVTATQLKVKDGSVILKGTTGSVTVADAMAANLASAFPKSLYKIENVLEVAGGAGSGEVVVLNSDGLIDSNSSLFDVLESSTVYFGSGRTRLGSGDQRRLKQLAARLKRDRSVKVEIIGHCDPSGDAESNALLAQRRCRSASDFLQSMGVSSDRMLTRALGAEGKSGGRSAEQRRVEFRLAPITTLLSAGLSQEQRMQRMQRVEELLRTTQVFFDTAKSLIKSKHQQQLHVLAQHLNALDEMPQIIIRGLADPRGNAAYNRKLSRQRCEAVFKELQSLGVDTSTIEFDEQGATTADLSDADSLRQARRVEFSMQRAAEVAA